VSERFDLAVAALLDEASWLTVDAPLITDVFAAVPKCFSLVPGPESPCLAWISSCRKRTKSSWQRCGSTPYLGGRSPIDFIKDGVEPPKAAEAGAYRDLSHRKSRFVEQPFCPLHAGRLGNLNRACSQVLLKEAIEMSCSDSQALRQLFDATLIQSTACDQTKSPLHSCP